MRVLIVEDHQKIAQSLKKGLSQESYAVDIAHDGETGLNEALYENYDVIILDEMLPERSGLSLLKELRSSRKHTPVLMLTAKDTINDNVQGLDAGADDYLTKPFEFEELLARLRAILRRPKQGLPKVLRCGDLELNVNTKKVTRAGKEISLSSKEYAMLDYFMRNQGLVLSKDQIRQHVWDFDSDILPNTVEAYIGYLRNKVDNPFNPPLIHTLRGFGYKLELKT